jgi:hypothetical protein
VGKARKLRRHERTDGLLKEQAIEFQTWNELVQGHYLPMLSGSDLPMLN